MMIKNHPTLYVGDLEEQISEETLYNYFTKFGMIYSVKVMRNIHNKRSRGFAFISFFQQAHAETAKKSANHEKILNNPIRVSWKKNFRELSPEANVFLKNLDLDITVKEIDEFFAKFGSIFSSKIAKNDVGQSLGYGYIQFDDKESADKCIQEFTENAESFKIKANKVEACKFLSKKNRTDARTNLYVKNLPNIEMELLETKLKEVSGRYGKVTSLCLKLDKNNLKPFAFICYETKEMAELAYNELQNVEMDKPGEKLYVNWAERKSDRIKKLKDIYSNTVNETNLFTKNLRLGVTQDQVKEAFSVFGTVQSCVLRLPPPITVPAKPQQETPEGVENKENAENNENNENNENKETEEKKETPAFERKQTQFAFINFQHKEDAREALNRAREYPQVVELFESPALVQVFYHMKKEQFKMFRDTQNRAQKMVRFGPSKMPYMMPNEAMMKRMPNMPPHMMMMPQMMPMMPMVPGMMPGGRQMRRQGPPNRNFPNQMPHGAMPGMPQPMGMGMGMGMPQGGMPQGMPGMPQPMGMGMGMPPMGMNMGMPGAPQQMGGQKRAPQMGEEQKTAAAKPKVMNVQFLKDNLNEFMNFDSEKQRSVLGEILFPLVKNKASEDLAPKVTGMLIDLDVFEVSEIIEFLESEEILTERVKEAMELISGSA